MRKVHRGVCPTCGGSRTIPTDDERGLEACPTCCGGRARSSLCPECKGTRLVPKNGGVAICKKCGGRGRLVG